MVVAKLFSTAVRLAYTFSRVALAKAAYWLFSGGSSDASSASDMGEYGLLTLTAYKL